MAERTPNLFLVGAMRSGTTALHEVLGTHPDIFMSSVKEPAFFTDPTELATDSRVASAAGFAADRARYLALFAGAGDTTYAGESSTHYTKQPRITGVAERMVEMSPDARIVYLVRDPVERTLSHYRYHVRAKYERRPCLEALRADPIYCATSDYAMQIEPYRSCFGAERVKMLVLEELAADGSRHLRELFDWLGVAPAGVAALPQRNEVGGDLARARGPELLHRAGRSPVYRQMATTLLPRRMRTIVRRLLNRPVAADETSSREVLAYLQRVHGPQVDAFEEIMGRPMISWTTVRPRRRSG